MNHHLLFSFSALLSLVTATLMSERTPSASGYAHDIRAVGAFALAVGVTSGWAGMHIAGNWPTGLAAALWLTIAVSLILFVGVCFVRSSARRMARLLLAYLVLLAALATAAEAMSRPPSGDAVPGFWMILHIGVSIVTYALVTLAAVAALAGLLQERALKAKRPRPLLRTLPPVAESEWLQVRLLGVAEAVLGTGLVSGMAVLYYQTGTPLRFDHKTVLSTAGFVVIGVLLIAHTRSGVRGRAAARLVLSAYLLLTLAYIGVKFVREVLLNGAITGAVG